MKPRRLLVTGCSDPWGLVVIAPGVGKGGTESPRIVPGLAKYENELAKLALRAKSESLIGERTSKNSEFNHLNSFLARRPNLPPLSSARSRAIWTRTIIRQGDPLIALRQAGVSFDSATMLAKLSAGLTLTPTKPITHLRFGEPPFVRKS